MSESEEFVVLSRGNGESDSDTCSAAAELEEFVILSRSDGDSGSDACSTATESEDFQAQPQYEYKSLPVGEYIRYLILEPGKDQEPLGGRLLTERLDDVPAFDAISYTWGSHEKIGYIDCDGKVIHLTANLRDALLRVRLPTCSRALWADQICINQEDPVERGHQVALMSKIYGKSRTTLIWLGPDDSHAEELLSLIDEVYGILNAQIAEYGSFRNLPVLQSTHPIANDPRWHFLATMTDFAWFRRVWVVQEAGLAEDPLILYGKYAFDWEITMTVLRWLNQQANVILERFHFRPNPMHMERLRIWPNGDVGNQNMQFYGGVRRWPFLQVLHFSRQLRASDPRDHVYAFLGHPSAQHPKSGIPIITPDYTRPVSQVNLDFALQYLEWTQDLNLLSYVQHGDDTSLEGSVPSWVPQWHSALGNVLGHDGQDVYVAGSQSRASPQFIENIRGLRVGAVIFDIIQYQSRAFTVEDIHPPAYDRPEHPEASDFNPMRDIWEHLSRPGSSCAYADNGRLRALVHTLVAGFTVDTPSQAKANAAAYLLRVLPHIEASPFYILSAFKDGAESGKAEVYENDAYYQGRSRKFIVTRDGSYGLAPLVAREGDICCVIFGVRMPFILRSATEPGHYKLVGEAYIHGTMHGQVVKRCEDGELQEEDITLV